MAVRLSHYLRNIPALIPLALRDLEAQILVLLRLTHELSSLCFDGFVSHICFGDSPNGEHRLDLSFVPPSPEYCNKVLHPVHLQNGFLVCCWDFCCCCFGFGFV